jgi:hypothetical protein
MKSTTWNPCFSSKKLYHLSNGHSTDAMKNISLFNYYNKKQYNTTSTQLMAIGYSKAIDHKVKLLGYEWSILKG